LDRSVKSLKPFPCCACSASGLRSLGKSCVKMTDLF
jgi:hypothetical protein